MLTKEQKKIIQVARRHDGTYHLPRRYPRRPDRWWPKNELDRMYDDCETLVSKQIARWDRGPSIRLDYRFL